MSDTAQNYIYLFVVLMLSIVILVVVFKYDLPAYSDFTAMYSQASDLREQLESLNNFSQELENLNINVQALQAERAKLSLFLPTDPKTAELVAIFDHIGRLSGFSIQRLNFSFLTSKKRSTGGLVELKIPPEVIAVSIGGKADYESLKRFLGSVEFSTRLMDVKSVSLSGPAPTQRDQLLDVGLVIQAYYQ